jgi:hypothetical protein
MSIYLQEEIWVTVQELRRSNAPMPRPLTNGFSRGKAYRVLGIHTPSETAEAYLILCNDRNEIWFISNQHFRVRHGESYSIAIEEEIDSSSDVPTWGEKDVSSSPVVKSPGLL